MVGGLLLMGALSLASSGVRMVADLPCLTPQGRAEPATRCVKAHDVRSFHPGQVADRGGALGLALPPRAAELGMLVLSGAWALTYQVGRYREI